MTRTPRPIAVGVVRRGDDLLLFAVPDHVKGVTGWRPPGGGIEFGERGEDTVVREFREELGVELVEPRYLGTLENIYVYLGSPGHEIVRVYAARFADASLDERERFVLIEEANASIECTWRPLAEFRAGTPLYPDGLLALIDGDG